MSLLAARSPLRAVLAAACVIILCPVAHGAMPSNARARPYGGGWGCVWGYRQAGDQCEAVRVPVDAYLESSGKGWECNRGFSKVEQQCVKAKIPSNAHLDDSW